MKYRIAKGTGTGKVVRMVRDGRYIHRYTDTGKGPMPCQTTEYQSAGEAKRAMNAGI